MAASAAGHGAVLAVLLWAPSPRSAPALPGAISVDLVAMAPSPAPAARAPAPAPAPKPAPPPPPPKAEVVPPPPKPAPEPPKPIPPRREAVLPKTPEKPPEARKPKERTPTEPRPEPPPPKARAEAPKRPSRPEPPRPTPPPERSYSDVMAELRKEKGDPRPAPVQESTASPAPGAAPPGVLGGPGAPVDPGVAAWLKAARIHVEEAWVLPPGFQREALQAIVEVQLDAAGHVVAQPRVVQRSGNPWYDESVVRAIQKASPLPPPPEPGVWQFEFRPPGGAA